MPQHPLSVKFFLPDAVQEGLPRAKRSLTQYRGTPRHSPPDLGVLAALAVLACTALWGSLWSAPAAYGAQPPVEARVAVEYFRQARRTLALVRLDLPAESYVYAHEAGAPVMPAVLALRDGRGRPLPVLYPVGRERRGPGVDGPVRVYVSGDILFVPLEDPAGSVLDGELSFALCTAEHCAFHTLDIRLRIPEGTLPDLGAGPLAQAFADARPGRSVADAPASFVEALPIVTLRDAAAAAAREARPHAPEVWSFQPRAFHASLEVGGLFTALLFGVLAGLLLNVMPCVLPVLALKAGALLRACGADQAAGAHRLREHMLFFAAGILSWFWLLALLLGGSGLIWGQLFQQSGVTYGLAALVFALGLSMLGVFNLPLVDLKAGGTDSPRLQAYFTGLLATLLATPCSGPLLGGVLAWAFSRNAYTLGLVFTAVGLGMALPCLLFALRPGLARFVPRPGVWLEVLERLVGFFLMGLSVYLIALLPEERRMPALASLPFIGAAAWLWGAYGGPGASARRRRMLGGLALGLLGAAIVCGLHTRPDGTPWEAFSPRTFRAALGGRPQVLVFTADWCPNCKALDHVVLDAARVRAWQKRYGARFVRVDLTRENAPGLALLRALGSSSIPFAAFFPVGENAHAPLTLRDMYTAGQFEAALEEAARP